MRKMGAFIDPYPKCVDGRNKKHFSRTGSQSYDGNTQEACSWRAFSYCQPRTHIPDAVTFAHHGCGTELGHAIRGPSIFTALENDGTSLDNVLPDQELLGGLVVALLLAWLGVYLQSSRNQNDFVLSRSSALSPLDPSLSTNNITSVRGDETFNESFSEPTSANETVVPDTNSSEPPFLFDDWKEMSRPDNYVWYNQRLRKGTNKSDGSSNWENPLVLVGLLALFVPIFSFEFFLTVSRQILCSGLLDQSARLCAPYGS